MNWLALDKSEVLSNYPTFSDRFEIKDKMSRKTIRMTSARNTCQNMPESQSKDRSDVPWCFRSVKDPLSDSKNDPEKNEWKKEERTQHEEEIMWSWTSESESVEISWFGWWSGHQPGLFSPPLPLPACRPDRPIDRPYLTTRKMIAASKRSFSRISDMIPLLVTNRMTFIPGREGSLYTIPSTNQCSWNLSRGNYFQ